MASLKILSKAAADIQPTAIWHDQIGNNKLRINLFGFN